MIRKKIFVSAYTEFNLGDDLFLKILFERYPSVDFYLKAKSEYEFLEVLYPNVKVYTPKKPSYNRLTTLINRISRRSFKFIYRINIKRFLEKEYLDFLREIDGYISIGGSIFMQPVKGDSYNLAYDSFIAEKLSQKPKFILGCNFGPYKSKWFRTEYEIVFSKFQSVSFRDLYSYSLFSSLNNVGLYPDIVLSLRVHGKEKKENCVGFTLRYCGEVDYLQYRDKHVSLITDYLSQGFYVKLFSFCEKEGDKKFLDDVVNRIEFNTENLNTFYYSGQNLNDFLLEYSTVKYMFAERFHSMILSFVFKQIVIPICYSDKMINVLEDFSFTGDIYRLNEFINVEQIRLTEIEKSNYFLLNESFFINAEKHFDAFDSFINKKSKSIDSTL